MSRYRSAFLVFSNIIPGGNLYLLFPNIIGPVLFEPCLVLEFAMEKTIAVFYIFMKVKEPVVY